MSKDALAKVVQRAISDAAFRRQLNSDPTGALRGFDLSSDELSALRTGDAGRLSTLGIDQRMSKAFAIGGALASTRLSQSDLTPGGGPAMVDDLSGSAGRTVIPADPAQVGSVDLDGGTSATGTVRVGDDWKFEGRVAPEGAGTVRTGDDWKFADRAASQGTAAPVEGSPEATAAENASGGGMANYPAHDGLAGPSGANTVRVGDDWKFASKDAGGGMANYPAHDGLAGPSGASTVRAGDDWARTSAGVADTGRIGSARLDDATGDTSGGASAINDDPDGFLAANANADTSGAAARANVIHDDPNGFLAANADVDTAGSVRAINDDPDGFLAANANADASGTASSGDGTAFIDESEAYLTKVGYDSSVTQTEVTDAHDRTYSGDDIAGPSTDSTSAGEGTAADHGDSSLTP